MGGEVGVFGKVFKVPAAEGAALQVGAGAQQDADLFRLTVLAQSVADLFFQGHVEGIGHAGAGGEAGGGNGFVEAGLDGAVDVLAQAVGAVADQHRLYTQAGDAGDVPEVGAGAEVGLFGEGHLGEDFLWVHGKAPFGET